MMVMMMIELRSLNEVYIAFEAGPVYTNVLHIEDAPEDGVSQHSTWHIASPHLGM